MLGVSRDRVWAGGRPGLDATGDRGFQLNSRNEDENFHFE